jgi:copper homeostasis protein
MNFELEVCAGSLTSALNAQSGGAHRVELCDNLADGGTTPSYASITLAKKYLQIPVFVLVRPRTGDFLYSDIEFETLKEDILICKEKGVEGIVIGILNADGKVDIKRTASLVEFARPMQVTFHRAFDMVVDPFEALEDIIRLGIERILTSGQQANSLEGAGLIAELVKKANNRIIIMPGGGITENNVVELIRKTGASEVHASLKAKVKSGMRFQNKTASMGSAGMDEYSWMETDPERVKRFIGSHR